MTPLRHLQSLPRDGRSDAGGRPVRHGSGVLRRIDASAIAEAEVTEAAALLSRDRLEEAGERFQAAARAFAEVGDEGGGARALVGLGRVLLGLQDPLCRDVLEDAGTCFEDLGDEAGMREVDQLLRAAEGSIDKESPRSFHSGG